MSDYDRLFKILGKDDAGELYGGTLIDNEGAVKFKTLTLYGENEKSHGQRGNRKGTLNFCFDLEGNLVEVTTYISSLKTSLSFFDDYETRTQKQGN